MAEYNTSKFEKYFVGLTDRHGVHDMHYAIVAWYDIDFIEDDGKLCDSICEIIVREFSNEVDYVYEVRKATEQELDDYEGEVYVIILDRNV